MRLCNHKYRRDYSIGRLKCTKCGDIFERKIIRCMHLFLEQINYNTLKCRECGVEFPLPKKSE